MVKKIFTISTWVLSCFAIIALFAFARIEQLSKPIKDLRLTINRPANGGFLEYKRTFSMIMKLTDSIPGKSLSRLDVYKLKNNLKSNPYVAGVEVYTTLEGLLKVDLEEREALVRVFDSTNQSAYIDTRGYLIPLHPDFSARVIIANGCFDYPPLMPNSNARLSSKLYKTSKLNEIFRLSQSLVADKFLNAFIAQVYVDSLGEFELTPRLTNTNIVIGKLDDLDVKLKNLRIFFLTKAEKTELNDYKTISLKYKNQIVCIKRQGL